MTEIGKSYSANAEASVAAVGWAKDSASELARSAGGSPAQVGRSEPPGSECCASRQQWRPRSVHSGCMGCVIEPGNTLVAGAEAVFAAERHMSGAVIARHWRPARVEEQITCKRS